MTDSHEHSFFFATTDIKALPVNLFQRLDEGVKEVLAIEDEAEKRKAAMPALLKASVIKNFIEHYFNTVDTRLFDIYAWQTTEIPEPPSTPEEFKKVFATTTAFRTTVDDGPKLKEVHPLSAEEYAIAQRFLQAHGQYEAAAFLINDAMLAYCEALEKMYLPHYVGSSDYDIIADTINALKFGVDFNPFTNEFIPVLAYEMSVQQQAGSSLNKGIMSGIHRHAASKNSLMISFDFEEDENGNPSDERSIVCPFQQAIGAVMNSKFDWNDNEKVTLQEGKEPAGLLKFSIRFLERHGVFTPSSTPQPKPSR